ncbi:MAG: hypothetical protein JWO76_1389 [Nocardioides sp.]|nr:hypothetical protein [Nocardioides sp.]
MSEAPPPEPPELPDQPEQPERPEGQRRRAPVVLALLTSVLVLTLAVSVPIVVQQVRAERDRRAAGPVNLDEVQVFEDLRNDHTEGDVDYPTTPPVGGPHDPVWLDCGVYDEPIRDENAVHDLEHGAVWITYEPGLDAGDVGTLAEALPDNGIMSPYDGLPAPVVVTVWGRQLALSGADDPRLALFLAGFSDGHTSPEPFASCAGGATESDGGTSTAV